MAREITEETGLPVETVEILDAWVYHIAVAAKDVFIVTYGCASDSDAAPVLSHEHNRIGEFTEHGVPDLPMPEGYKRSIATWFDRLHTLQAAGQSAPASQNTDVPLRSASASAEAERSRPPSGIA